ncbi:MAG: helix-turn-helix domain-containing protein [Candidatus Methanofastidiosia archaeon]
MIGKDVDELIEKALENGEKKYTRESIEPYYKRFGFEDDPFKVPSVFIAPSQRLTITEISRFIGGSKKGLNCNIAVVGPKWIGKTTLLKKIHCIAENRGYDCKRVNGSEFRKRTELEIDGEMCCETFFERFLDEITEKTDFIIIDETDELKNHISFYLEGIREQTKFFSLIITLFDVITWDLLPFSTREIFYKVFYLCPLTEKENRSVLLSNLDKPRNNQKNPFTEEAINQLVRVCNGSPGLLIDLARKSMRAAHLAQDSTVTEETVTSVIFENIYKEVDVLNDAFEASSKRNIIRLMLDYAEPLTATQVSERMELTRQTICYHLGEMLEQGIVLKMPKVGRNIPYQVALPSRIAFEHWMLKRCLNE